MSKFNHYAVDADRIAKEAFKEYRKAETALENAEQKVKEYPEIFGQAQSDEYRMNSAVAKADLLKAQDGLKIAQAAFRNHMNELNDMRTNLVKAIETEYGVTPSDVDQNTMELLKSGLLTAKDFERLMENAKKSGNHTMVHMIAKYAGEKAEIDRRENNDLSADGMLFESISHEGNMDNGQEILNQFDVLLYAFDKTSQNPLMIDNWEELTSSIVESM